MKKVFLSVCMLIAVMSATAFAENTEKIDIHEEGYEIVLDFENSGNVYTGEVITPEVDVVKKDENGVITDTLTSEDFAAEYSDNLDAGDAVVTVTGCGNYTGNLEADFTINKATLDKAEITLSEERYVYDGAAKKPAVTVTFNGNEVSADNYSVAYSDNTEAGDAKVLVTANETSKNFAGSKEKVFTIHSASLEDATVTLPYKYYIYNGEYRKPAPTVKIAGKVMNKANYSVKYSNNRNVGTATVTITGKNGNLTGTKTVTFTIGPKSTTISLTRAYNEVVIKWAKVEKATGYKIYRSKSKDSGYKVIKTVNSGNTVSYSDKTAKHNVKYYYKVRAIATVDGKVISSAYSPVKNITVRVAKATIKTIARVDFKTLKISWDPVKGATGYRIYRSKSKDGTYLALATLSGNDNVSYKDIGLKCGRTYYYKVRAYRESNDTKYFGTYSDAKKNNTRPSKVNLTGECFYKATKAKLMWKRSSGANGYEIYRSTTENGTYKKVKKITSQETLQWTNTGLSKTKSYYYKVRAFCEVDGKTVYGAFSGVFEKSKAGWRYSTFQGKKIKYYYNADNERVDDVRNLIGKQDSYVIKVNKQRATVTVYAKDGDNGYIIPVVAFVCSPGYTTPEGTFNTQQKLRWHELMGPCWGQWNTRISGSYLFHSVFYNSYRDNDALSVTAYNKLGTVCSHGCVRLTAGDAKWIYDNCKLGTKVIIYNDSTSGPLGKPSAVKLPYWHTWDPTDPNKFDKCDSYGCH